MTITTLDLWNDGRSIQLSAGSISSTVPASSSSGSLTLIWTLPSPIVAYNGAVVLLSTERFTGDNVPVDGTRYSASTNFQAPASLIGNAQVVAAFYGFFGDNIQQTSVTVTGLDPSKVYFASIHACSNVLQYYSQGVQSYPLDSDVQVKNSSPFAGSIPESSTPPQNPSDGQTYFDLGSKMVLMWNAGQGAWIKLNKSTVPIGDAPYIDVGLIFYNTGTGIIKYFDGAQLQLCTSANTRVKMAGTWAPFTKITQSGSYPTSPSVGDFLFYVMPAALSAPNTYALQFFSLGMWYNVSPGLVEVLVNGVWTPIAVPTTSNSYSNVDPLLPSVGDFFYNTATKQLLVWTGSAWSQADTAQPGVPSPDKIGVGTDGTGAARQELLNEVKARLGYPSVCVELKDSNFNLAISNALATLRQLSDAAYDHRFISYTLIGGPSGGQSTYYLNDPRDKTNKIVDVIKIHRINQLGVSSLSAEGGLYAQAFFNQLYQGSNVDVISIHLMNQLSKTYEKIFAGDMMFTWNEASRELIILRRLLQAQERVLLEVTMEREEQEIINDRWTKMWVQDWVYADCLEQLGQIRSKYTSALPGANGGVTLNGDQLLTMAETKKTELRRQLLDFEVGTGTSTNFSVFIC